MSTKDVIIDGIMIATSTEQRDTTRRTVLHRKLESKTLDKKEKMS
jgi:hypothetical protein